MEKRVKIEMKWGAGKLHFELFCRKNYDGSF
jgi:hypothetical protein